MTPERKMIETCACHRIRMLARAVTRSYDEALRPVGLRATQVSVLAAVAAEGAMSITALADAMGMDRSTLTRNLSPLQNEGLLTLGTEGWRRSRMLTLTAKGRSRLQAAMPLWEGAQRQWEDIQRSLGQLMTSASRARARSRPRARSRT